MEDNWCFRFDRVPSSVLIDVGGGGAMSLIVESWPSTILNSHIGGTVLQLRRC